MGNNGSDWVLHINLSSTFAAVPFFFLLMTLLNKFDFFMKVEI